MVQLTERGRSVIMSALPAHVSRIAGALTVLTPDEQLVLGRLCKKLGIALAPA